jgi:hypothetical protein
MFSAIIGSMGENTAKGSALDRFRVAIEEIIPFLKHPELIRMNDARGFLVVLGTL